MGMDERWEREARSATDELEDGGREAPSADLPAVPDLSRIRADGSARSGEGWRWRRIGAMRLNERIDEIIVPPLPCHAVLVNVGRPYRLEEKLDGRVYRTSGAKGDVAVIPAGVPTEFRTREREPQQVESFVMLLEPAFVRETVEGAGLAPDRIELAGVLGARLPAIEQIGMALLTELEDDGLLGELYAESLATSLAVHLVRSHSSLGRSGARETSLAPTGRLSTAELRRVTAFVEDNLDGDLPLAKMAGVAHMSAFHFARLFKLSTGRSPHQYVVQRRVERAKELLTSTDLPLHEVAHRSGFADQSHLAKHTRRLLGATPRTLRRASE